MEREILLLGILRRQEMHGYQLSEFIEQNLGGCTNLKKPTAYYLLEGMEKNGWVTTEQSQPGNRPPRRVYQITPAGEAAYQQLLRESLAEYTPVTFQGDLPLAFLQEIPAAEALPLLEQRLAKMQAEQERLMAAPVHHGTAQWLVEHQQRHLQCELAWLEEILRRVENFQDNSNIKE